MGKSHATFNRESCPPGAPLSLLKFSVRSHARHSAESSRPPSLRGGSVAPSPPPTAWLEKVSNNIVNSPSVRLSVCLTTCQAAFFWLASLPSQSKPKRRWMVKFRRYIQAGRRKMPSTWFHTKPSQNIMTLIWPLAHLAFGQFCGGVIVLFLCPQHIRPSPAL